MSKMIKSIFALIVAALAVIFSLKFIAGLVIGALFSAPLIKFAKEVISKVKEKLKKKSG